MAFDIYAAVTDRIIQQMEQGCVPWTKPWTGVQNAAISGTTGKPYSLLNQMLLNKSGPFYTFNQVQKLGGTVRKGEHAAFVVFWKQIPVKEQDSQTGVIKENLVPMLRYYKVFHIDQCEGISAPTVTPVPQSTSPDAESIICDYLQRSGVDLIHQVSDEAYYSPSRDRVVLPKADQFNSTAEYYSTAFHELAHSTGHQSRLDRLRATARFGGEILQQRGTRCRDNRCSPYESYWSGDKRYLPQQYRLYPELADRTAKRQADDRHRQWCCS